MRDPRTARAALEIAAILRRHDLAGCVIVSSPTHTQLSYALAPSWSCATQTDTVHWLKAARGPRWKLRLTVQMIIRTLAVLTRSTRDMDRVLPASLLALELFAAPPARRRKSR